uniref:Acetyl-CoA carboxylase n=2 Tax=Caenorhabditis tropicalis TaxID=1561998 RepID=A0A1I7T9U3_9PELO
MQMMFIPRLLLFIFLTYFLPWHGLDEDDGAEESKDKGVHEGKHVDNTGRTEEKGIHKPEMPHPNKDGKQRKLSLLYGQCGREIAAKHRWNDSFTDSRDDDDRDVTIELDSPTLNSINYAELLDTLGLALSSSICQVSLTFSGSVSNLGRPFNMSVNGHKPELKKFNVIGNSTIRDTGAEYKSIDAFVEANVSDVDKRRPIKRLLVATNGIAAVRCMTTIMRLMNHTFRNDKLIQFICMATQDEITANSEFIKNGTTIVMSPSGSNKNNYANVDEVVRHAVENKVDAVWAGWGHASENPDLPRKLSENKIAFIGPPASAMFSLGDKIASTIIAQTVGIPTIAWSGAGICMKETKRNKGDFVVVPDDLLAKACVKNSAEGLEALKTHNIGFPLMIKASEGGGGKGIRKCTKIEDFKSMFQEVTLEVPGSPIFLMRCVENARHIEVQLIADRYENVISVFTRDCSIQRRCQKIIEEAPACVAPSETRKRMQEDAVRIAKYVGYESAGTVEYLYLPEDDTYYFLELNPRLQVEHPATEMISNISIPAIQIQIAMGLPLHKIADIRNLYNLPKNGDCELPDEVLVDTPLHSIAARITSEDPDDGFRPSTGQVRELNFRSSQDAWAYFSVSGGGRVHEFADSQFGHLFARGTSRHQAIGNILGALKEMEIKASFKSQVSYLIDLIHEPDFTNNYFNTQWLDERIAKKIKQKCTIPLSDIIAISAAVIGYSRVTHAFDSFKGAIERGQVLPPNDLTETFLFDLVRDLKIYSVKVTRSAPDSFVIVLNGSKTNVKIVRFGEGGTLIATHGEISYHCNLEESPDAFKVTIKDQIITFEKDNDPSVLKSPYTGKFLSYKKEEGEFVDVGEVFATVESMKLVFNVEVKKAPGRLQRVLNEGDLIFPGSVIGRLVDQKDSELYRPQKFFGSFPEWTSLAPSASENRVHAYNTCLEKCRNILAGSVPLGGAAEVSALVTELFRFLNVNNLPRFILEPTIVQVTKTFPQSVQQSFFDAVEKPCFTGDKLVQALNGYVLPQEDRVKFDHAVKEFAYGANGFAAGVLNSLLSDYISVEKYFEGKGYDDSVAEIKENNSNGDAVVQTIYSHTQIKSKNIVIKAILEALKQTGSTFIPSLLDNLREIGNLHHTEEISSLAREILLIFQNLCYKNNYSGITASGLTATVEEVKLWLQSPLAKRPDSTGWKVIHEYFFDSDIGSQCLDRYVATHISAESGYVENTYTLPQMGCTINHFTLIPKPTSFNKIVLKGNKLIVVRLSIDSETYKTCFSNADFLDCLKKNFSLYCKKDDVINVSIFVKIINDKAVHHDASTLTEQEEQKVFYAQNAVVDIKAALEKNFKVNRVNTVLCLHDRPLPQLTIFEQVRLEKDRLPVNSYPVLSRLSSVRAYQQDDAESNFAKLFIRQQLIIPGNKAEDVKKKVSQAVFLSLDNACTAAQVAMAKKSKTGKERFFAANHVFVFISCPGLPKEVIASEEHLAFMKECIIEEVESHKSILAKHQISEVEMVYESIDGHKRIVIRDETGVTTEVITKFSQPLGIYPTVSVVDKKRFAARRVNSSYIYDFPIIFGMAAINSWTAAKSLDESAYNRSVAALPPAMAEALRDGRWREFFNLEELVFDNDKLVHITDAETLQKRSKNALNKCGMVAWIMKLYTPEKPRGYEVVLIGNDVTFQSGSFGTAEDDLFAAASAYSREHKLPRVNVSVNSGARIGLSTKISKLVKVQLKNEEKPDQGHDYIYVDGQHKADVEGQVVYEELDNGRLKILAVIGAKNEKIGVENLQGSGLIAGETSRAYFEVPTYCYVTGRSVGIGAYTARLAHRIVQHKQSHLILTGYEALNTLLGKKVYTSNNQLGGPEVMFRNGVTHAVVDNDLEGIAKVLRWMSFLPSENKSFPFFSQYGNDSSIREVRIPLTGGDQYDVRHLIDSKDLYNKHGICDTMSFDEICGDWAKSIVAGRARLCGIPIGVVASEFRNFSTTVPADPALEGSQIQNTQRAGQVWYPDSAFKTAEAINDLNKENLPLLIIASLRGFSGGQKDMYDMVLKFGAQIVDALAVYNRPVIVYIPEAGELRGGAWAVLDSKIRPEFIHLVADEKSRGGILEPNAVVGIKFRKPVMAEMMKRCDESYAQLSADSNSKKEAEERYTELSKVYRNAAVEFADAHDRWQRMKSVGAVDHVTSLKNSRKLFFELIRNELAKVGMAETYSNAPHASKPPCLASSMTWVENNLKTFETPSASMDEEYTRIEAYHKTRFVTDLVAAVTESQKLYEKQLSSYLTGLSRP